MSTPHDRLMVFDGYCHVCSGWAQFMRRHPVDPPFRLIAMQSEEGKALLVAHGIDPEDPTTFLVIEGARVMRESDGAIHVVTVLGGLWRGFSLARLLPRPVRDGAYRLLARNRYKWFGRRTTCFLPD